MSDQSTFSHLKSVSVVGQSGVVDLQIAEGRIAQITPSQVPAQTVVMPLMADAHVHLDKTFTARRTGGGSTSLFDAIDRMDADKTNWTPEDLYNRGMEALEKSWRHGVAAMRTHVDWTTPEMPTGWRVMQDLRDAWRGRVHLQVASLSPIDLLHEHGQNIAAQVKADDAVLGAFVFKNDNLASKIKHVFALSDQYGLDLDFHVDEGLDVAAQGFDLIVDCAAKRKDGPRVLCGHACSLSIRPDDDVQRILGQAAQAQVGLVVLPTTNMYLQDNQPDRTPRLRGIAPMKEAKKAGVDVLIASDNVRDVFYPYGDYDLFDVYRGCLPLGHLDPVTWLDAVTYCPDQWCGGGSVQTIAQGAPASFIAFDAPSFDDALSRSDAKRRIFREGVQVA